MSGEIDKRIDRTKANELENMIKRIIDCVLTKSCIDDRIKIDTFIVRQELRKENIQAVIYNPYLKLYTIIKTNGNTIVLNVMTELEFKHLLLRLISDIGGMQL